METKELTCVVCPAGCHITVELDGGKVLSVTGNTCIRGKNYAESEITNPVRTLTSSVKIKTEKGFIMLPVRTDKPIPKSKLFAGMDLIHKAGVSLPVKAGDVIIKDFIEEGTDLIACKSVK